MRPRRSRGAIARKIGSLASITAVGAALALLSGCGRVHFRLAMGRVQRSYVAILDRVERGWVEETREAAPRLERALLDPAITESRFYRDESFRALHREVLEKVAAIAGPAPPEDLPFLLGEVSAGCRACHERFR